jgi:undecaprenyl-diphosphatase
VTHAWAVLLGLIQGATEFLPISSSAHLLYVPQIFHLKDPVLDSLAFDIALHAGSFVAILVALWADWLGLARDALIRPASQEAQAKRLWSWKLIGFFLLTSIPGAIFGVALEKQAETAFRMHALLTAASLIVFGLLLWAVDRFTARQEPVESMTWVTALLIGLAQALAIVPGVSRSGSTMTAGRALGLSREAIVKYSFMAGLVIIGGAAVFGLRHVPIHELLSLDWMLGFIAAAISSFVAMKLLLTYVRNHSLAAFTYYRLAAGALLVILVVSGSLKA